jgi:hypothetical protein
VLHCCVVAHHQPTNRYVAPGEFISFEVRVDLLEGVTDLSLTVSASGGGSGLVFEPSLATAPHVPGGLLLQYSATQLASFATYDASFLTASFAPGELSNRGNSDYSDDYLVLQLVVRVDAGNAAMVDGARRSVSVTLVNQGETQTVNALVFEVVEPVVALTDFRLTDVGRTEYVCVVSCHVRTPAPPAPPPPPPPHHGVCPMVGVTPITVAENRFRTVVRPSVVY